VAAAAAAEISIQAGYRAPRDTATSPAMTPPPPTIAAAHSPSVTSRSGSRIGSSAGSGPVGSGTGGTVALDLVAEATIMIRIALPMPSAASQPGDSRPGRVPAGR
jgi:hypothetical protein